jgi:predicted nuclease with TOPRIM domain
MSDNIHLQKENVELREEVERLKKELDRIYSVFDKNFAVEILDHLNFTDSITQTANYYGLDPKWLYLKIPEWDDCNERLYGLSDYKEYENTK